MGSIPNFTPSIGPDGLAADAPIIAYTEKILEEKEQKLKQYIQDNYSKIRNVEKELATLALEVKLTAGPKKHALEHLRKRIEASTEKIKLAKVKEVQARKAFEAAQKTVQTEEEIKTRLCEDLNRLVHESAAVSYSRLEELTRRLEALNPKDSPQASSVSEPRQPLKTSNKETNVNDEPAGDVNGTAISAAPSSGGTLLSHPDGPKDHVTRSTGRTQNLTVGQHVNLTRGRGSAAGRTKGSLVLGSKPSEAAGWTGAGFSVQDEQ